MTMQVITAALCKAKTKTIRLMDLKAGDIAHAHGARFHITRAEVRPAADGQDVMLARGAWVDGAVDAFYFGPDKPWTFQGNQNARVSIEI